MNLTNAWNRRAFLLAGSSAVHTFAQKRPPAVPREAVIPAALTPFDADLRIDRGQFVSHIKALAAIPGVSAIMVNGAAGQDSALSRDERRLIVAEALAAVGDRTPILVALREKGDTIGLSDLARDAVAEKAHALLVMPPPDKTDLEWEKARIRFQRVFDAGTLPVAVYHTAYSTETLARIAALPPLFAVKEGSGDPAAFERNMRAVRALGRNVAVWSTNSRWLLADLAVGADGILSGMGSVAADLHAELAAAVRRSDLAAARRVNDRLFPLTQVFYRPGLDAHTRMKYALVHLGRWRHDFVRPPYLVVEAAERTRIEQALALSGLSGTTGRA